MSAVPEGAAAPSGVSTRRGATGASVGRGTAPLRTGWPRTPPEVNCSPAPPLAAHWGAGREGPSSEERLAAVALGPGGGLLGGVSAERRPARRGRQETALAGDGPLLLLVRAVTLQTRTVSNNAPSAARHQERVTDSAGTCTKGLAGGAVCPGPPPDLQAGPGGRWEPSEGRSSPHLGRGPDSAPRLPRSGQGGAGGGTEAAVAGGRAGAGEAGGAGAGAGAAPVVGRLCSVGRTPKLTAQGDPGPGFLAGRGNGRGRGPHRRGRELSPTPSGHREPEPRSCSPAFASGWGQCPVALPTGHRPDTRDAPVLSPQGPGPGWPGCAHRLLAPPGGRPGPCS